MGLYSPLEFGPKWPIRRRNCRDAHATHRPLRAVLERARARPAFIAVPRHASAPRQDPRCRDRVLRQLRVELTVRRGEVGLELLPTPPRPPQVG